MKTEIRKELEPRVAYLKTLPEDQLRNEKVLAFVRASVRSMRFRTAEEVMQLMKHSTRAYGDLVLALLDDHFSMPFALRRWDPRVAPETEIRMFVCNRRFVAATQYYTLLYSKFLHEHRAAILAKLERFFTGRLSPVIPLVDYTLDVSCLPDKLADPVSDPADCFIVIEINPPPPKAGTGLFLESSRDDMRVVREGPLELRVCTAIPPATTTSELDARLTTLMDTIVPPPPPSSCIVN
eukprot:TRINITY_DN2499_c0_g4_i1.p1 TRINITY_DN2499_c0_g4~~TRINITY_DN2499_c0_g4_i1.p1  ORF type:complete len:238 (-),score=63.97 TRINITY_DN2499_c0_g4_i1:101-814(-)